MLRDKDWSYRKAAPLLGVTYQYLSDVANGRRISRRLYLKIQQLPHYTDFITAHSKYKQKTLKKGVK